MADNLNFNSGITINLVSAAMVAGTTSTYTTTVTTTCVINGKFATTLGAQTNTATPTTDANTAAAFVALQPNQTCCLVLGTNLAGAIKMVQGADHLDPDRRHHHCRRPLRRAAVPGSARRLLPVGIYHRPYRAVRRSVDPRHRFMDSLGRQRIDVPERLSAAESSAG